MKQEQIDRINELYRKSKAEGLTEAEKKEQDMLRKQFVADVRSNLTAQLNNIDMVNADGTVENIHKLNAGSGYLALDQNKDGIINDGSELFGTKSGDGFADLAKYDEDHNGWIDENDSIFEQLKIWVQDGDGNGSLYSLKEQNVGAICLNNAPTYINQYDKNGAVSAVIRSTGMFLFENGRAGTMQHLDMAT